MANLSIREAVKHYDVSRPTLTKALKSGKISGGQDGQGRWSIDPSELARVYRPRSVQSDTVEEGEHGKNRQKITTSNPTEITELYTLRAQLAEIELRAVKAEARAETAELLAKERAERIEDLRRMLPSPDQNKKRKWWQRG